MTNERVLKYRGFQLALGVREVDLGLFEPVAQARREDSPDAALQDVPFDRRWLMSLSEAWQMAESGARKWVDGRF